MAMKRYMNREQRTEFVTFGTLLGFTTNVLLKKWEGRFLTEEEMSVTYDACRALKYVHEGVISRMDGDYAHLLQKDEKALQIIALPKEKAYLELKDFKSKKEVVTMDREILDTIAGVSMELCSRCYKDDEEQKDCLLRVCYLSAGIEVYNDEAEGCPYKIDDPLICNEFLADFTKRLFKELQKRGRVVSIEDNEAEQTTYKVDSSLRGLSEESPKEILEKFKGVSVENGITGRDEE